MGIVRMRVKLARCVLPLVGVQVLAVVAGCAEQVGPSDAEVYTALNNAVLDMSAQLNQLQCDGFRRMPVTEGALFIHASCEYSINTGHYEKVAEFVEMTKAMPLAFGHPIETVHRSVAAEHSLHKADQLNGQPFQARIRYQLAADGAWHFVNLSKGGR
jgi:hypothetical protein